MSSGCGIRSVLPQLRTADACDIRSEVHKRNGAELWWCHTHGMEVGGGGVGRCLGSDTAALRNDQIFTIDVADYPGGVAAWGATEPAACWGEVEIHGGVHLHARRFVGGMKEIDESFALVRITSGAQTVEIDEASAIAHLVSAVAGRVNVVLQCTHCGWLHLDRDEFAVTPHKKHLCNRCGRNFWNTELTIANPLAGLAHNPAFTVGSVPVPATETLKLRRSLYTSISIWGSNPAIVWTSELAESEGIHVHARDSVGDLTIDDTYGSVEIDHVRLDPELVRLLMVQRTIPSVCSRIVSLSCPHCASLHADRGDFAFRPRNEFVCAHCDRAFVSPGRRNVVSNPLIQILADLDMLPSLP
jgi:transposase-like protein